MLMQYMVEPRAGGRIFLEANHLEDTFEFDKCLHTSSKDTISHLHHHLPGEKWYVRAKLEENALGMVTSSTPSLTVDSESEDRTMASRKHQGRRRLSYPRSLRYLFEWPSIECQVYNLRIAYYHRSPPTAIYKRKQTEVNP